MAISKMVDVWRYSSQSGTKLLAMLALADWTNEEGYAYPSYERLAEKLRCSRRYAIEVCQELAEAGELEIVERPGHSNLFRIVPEGLPEPEEPVEVDRSKWKVADWLVYLAEENNKVAVVADVIAHLYPKAEINFPRIGAAIKRRPFNGDAGLMIRQLFAARATQPRDPVNYVVAMTGGQKSENPGAFVKYDYGEQV